MNTVGRRSVLLAGLGGAATAALTGCGPAARDGAEAAAPDGAPARPAEHRLQITAAAATVDLGGGVTPKTWAYDGRVPGAEVRLTAGDTLVAELVNQLPDQAVTAVHWHGIGLPNDMDGAPPVTQTAVAPGAGFTYRVTPATPGTYFYHSHVDVQLDRAMYGPLIVDDPREPLAYDDEWVVVLDDWLDGIDGVTPDDVLARLMRGRPGGGSGGPGGGKPPADATSDLLGGGGGPVSYPYHLINGRVPADPAVYRGTTGHRVRLRIINAGSDTAYRVALGGHRLTITHTDGYPVQHRTGDAVLIGMGERYDAVVTLKDGVFPLVAEAEGKDGHTGMALVRTAAGAAPPAGTRPAELDGAIITAARLTAAEDVTLHPADPDVTHEIRLTGGMAAFDWSINGVRFDMNDFDANPLLVQRGQRVRLDFVNESEMWHPMHLHGHTYQLGTTGARKDTTIVVPHETVTVYFDADNPGKWLLHCHNVYHGEAGMMALIAYA